MSGSKNKRREQNINSHIYPQFEKDSDETKSKNIGKLYTEQGNILNTYCQIELQDLINFYEVEFRIIRGYYYVGDRDYSVRETITKLFHERKLLQKDDNPLNNCIKLMMNGSYGKAIQRIILSSSKFISGNCLQSYITNNYYKIKSIREITHNIENEKDRKNGDDMQKFDFDNDDIFNYKKLYEVKVMNQVDQQFSMVPFGVDVLAMSKRIMNEVMCLAYDNDLCIWYQDTDSMHIEKDHIPKLKDLFKEKYGK